MYKVWLNKTLLPIAPSAIQIKTQGGNKTVNLINDGEVNLIKPSKLTEFSFDFILPNSKLPFAEYNNGKYKDALWFLNRLEKLKNRKTPFTFKILRIPVSRVFYSTSKNFDTTMKVTIENYTINEDADKYGFDICVSIKLKQYKPYATKKIVAKKVVKEKKLYKNVPKTYTVKKGDTLTKICRKYYKDTSYKSNLYAKNKKVIESAAKKNGKKSSSKGKHLYKGTKLKMLDITTQSGSKGNNLISVS